MMPSSVFSSFTNAPPGPNETIGWVVEVQTEGATPNLVGSNPTTSVMTARVPDPFCGQNNAIGSLAPWTPLTVIWSQLVSTHS